MAADAEQNLALEIAHVLFIDIVGYSKLLTSEQRERQQELNRIVRETEPFKQADVAGKLIRVPTGDGMVLAFFTTPDAPVRCAIAISRALRTRADLPLRMGIHSGPVDLVHDVNERENLAGAGVNIAQRVMDCGDAGHILLSARAADDLAQHANWNSQLHDVGEVTVKHGVRVRVVSLYTDEFGNAALPQKVQRERAARRRRTRLLAAADLAVIALSAGAFWVYRSTLPHNKKLRTKRQRNIRKALRCCHSKISRPTTRMQSSRAVCIARCFRTWRRSQTAKSSAAPA